MQLTDTHAGPAGVAVRVAGGRSAGPVWVVGVALLALWLATGVTVGEVATFVAYEAVFVIGPGWLLYRALVRRREERIRQLVFGWSLGYVLEIGAFVLTAAFSFRSLMVLYPVVVAAVVVPILHRRRGLEARNLAKHPAGWSWAVAVICVLVLGYVGVKSFAPSPLPDRVSSVSYGVDPVWYLSLVAEARHHWPVEDPTVVRESLPYHWFSSFDAAAISQVTGIRLPVVFFRLYLVPLVLLVAVALCVAGQAISRRAWVGPIAAVLVLFVTELNVSPYFGYSFANELSDDIVSISPSFLFGMVFFVPTLIVLHELCDAADARQPSGKGWWAILALLLVGCVGAKASILPVLIVGLSLYLVWRRLVTGSFDGRLTAALGLTLALCALAWVIEYRHAGISGLTLHPPGALRQMNTIAHFASRVVGPAASNPLSWAVATAIGLAGAYAASLCGVAWAFSLRDAPAPPGHFLLAALLIAGLVPYLAFTHFGLSQVFFAEYGVAAACLLSAEGLYMLWRRLRGTYSVGVFAGVIAAGVSALLAIAFGLEWLLGLDRGALKWIAWDFDIGLAAIVVVAGALAVRARFRPSAKWLFAVTTLLLVGAAAKPLEGVTPSITRLARGEPLYSSTGRPLTAGLLRGLTWLRDHTPADAVIAVSNYGLTNSHRYSHRKIPDYYYYSAFSERRVFLEGWIYAQRSIDNKNRQIAFPFRYRNHLNDAVFLHADPAALQTLTHRYGVSYLVVDKVHPTTVSPRLPALTKQVFSNQHITIYRVPFSPRG